MSLHVSEHTHVYIYIYIYISITMYLYQKFAFFSALLSEKYLRFNIFIFLQIFFLLSLINIMYTKFCKGKII